MQSTKKSSAINPPFMKVIISVESESELLSDSLSDR